ncbi:MAG: glycosyltransferase family 2 protein, partial [Candidatus Cloacimonetes bacterium]|nr:glycosyltransferase family 2 protein [Candidatus Cloacimonadota bacterium]
MEFIEDLVSVIIPVFNAGRFLDRTIQSVLGQTYRQIEIILVDDCSKDNSAQIIKTYMHDHSQILYFLQKKNMGAGVARNKALELAK